jgi:hypothetical protein
MKRRIGLWALAGFFIACGWVIYGMAAGPNQNIGQWTVAAITAPASLLGRTIPLALYSFVFLNAAVYALLGFATELLLRPNR